MTYKVPPDIMKALVSGILDAAEQTETDQKDDVLLDTFTTVLDDHGAELPDDMRTRFVQLAKVRNQFMKACRAFDREHTAGNEDAAAAGLIELEQLRLKAKEISDYMQFSMAAETLIKAKGFDEFCALLPLVELDRLHGSGHGKVSPFPLIWALSARKKPLERVQLMLAAGARIDLATRLGETVLHAMAGMKRKAAIRLPILRLLVFKGANLEAMNIHDQTPLTIAIDRGSIEDVGFFLDVGSNIRPGDLKLATADPRKLRLLLDHLSNSPERLGEAARLGGWLRGEIEWWSRDAKEALRNGAKGVYHGKLLNSLETSLAMLAALPGYEPHDETSKVTWQEEPGAFWAIQGAETLDEYRSALGRVYIETFYMPGTHPIYWPLEAKDHRPERLWLMLSAGASVVGGENGTALHIFARERRKDAAEQFRMAQMIVQAGGDVEALNYEGLTPLACAIKGGGYAEAAALLKLGASPNLSLSTRRLYGDRYEAPILFAAADDVRIFKCMLDIGGEPLGRDSDGNTLREFIKDEIARLKKMRDKSMSSTIKRQVDRSIRNFEKSLKHLNKSAKVV